MMPPVKYGHPWYRKTGLVYFIAAGDPPCAIKIGVSTHDAFGERLRSIQSANHERIKVLGVIHFDEGDLPMRDAELLERKLHQQFRGFCRAPLGLVGAEWFTAVPELLSFIDTGLRDQTIKPPAKYS
jgi:T5orf172 domain